MSSTHPSDESPPVAEQPANHAQPVPQNWIDHATTAHSGVPLYATQVHHLPTEGYHDRPLPTDSVFENAGRLDVRYVSLEYDAALVIREPALRNTQTEQIYPRIVYDRGPEAWRAVVGRYKGRVHSLPDSTTKRDRRLAVELHGLEGER